MTTKRILARLKEIQNSNNIIKLINDISDKKNIDCILLEDKKRYEEIWKIVKTMENKVLKEFITNVLTDKLIMKEFYIGRASATYHHNKKGDLFKHSFEVAITAMKLADYYGLSNTDKEACFISGLIHDIGKIKMFYNNPQLGTNTEHESLGFMVLGKHLESLQLHDTSAFEAITNCITSKRSQQKAAYVIEDIVRAADQISSSINSYLMAFNDKPGYFHYSKDASGKIYKRLFDKPEAN